MDKPIQNNVTGADNFYKSERVSVRKVYFLNQYKMTICGNLFIPKDIDKTKLYPAIIVGHPMGQSKNKVPVCMPQR